MLDPARKTKVTGSEIATIISENVYESPEDLMFKKCFDMPFAGNEATKHGQRFEPVALQKLAAAVGGIYIDSKFVECREYPWIGATIDGRMKMPDGEEVLVEIKCPLSRKIIPGVVPIYYYG